MSRARVDNKNIAQNENTVVAVPFIPPLVHETKNAAAAGSKQWCAQRPEKKNTNKKNKMKSDETNAPKCTEHSRTSERNDARQKKPIRRFI